MNDALVRQMMGKALPQIDLGKLEVCMVGYDVACGYWYRDGHRILQGKAIAIQRTETEVAADLAANLASHLVDEVLATADISPYEGQPGRHPRNCTCTKHINGQS